MPAPKTKQSLIKYINGQQKPKVMPDSGATPIHNNYPDIIRLIPNERRELVSGMEIATPPGHVLLTTIDNRSLLHTCNFHVGYQPELRLYVCNTSSSIVEIQPGEKIGNLYLLEIKTI